MADRKAIGIPLNDKQLTIVGGAGASGDCGVPEAEFPRLAKCHSKSSTISGVRWEKICPYCSIWTSLPEGASLSVTYIVECCSHGYGKRIKE